MRFGSLGLGSAAVILTTVGLAACGSDGGGGSSATATGGVAGAGGSGGAAAGTGGVAGVAGGGSGGQPPAVGDVVPFASLGSSSEGLAFAKNAAGEDRLYVTRSGIDDIAEVAPDGSVTSLTRLVDGRGMATTAAGTLLVCGRESSTASELVIFEVDVTTGNSSVLVRGDVEPFPDCDSIAVGPDDRIVFSEPTTGKIYRAEADGSSLAIMNADIPTQKGLALNAEGTSLFVGAGGDTQLWTLLRDTGTGVYGLPEAFGAAPPLAEGVVVLESGDIVLLSEGSGVQRLSADGSSLTAVAAAGAFDRPKHGVFGVGEFGSSWLYVTNRSSNELARLRFADDETGLALPRR